MKKRLHIDFDHPDLKKLTFLDVQQLMSLEKGNDIEQIDMKKGEGTNIEEVKQPRVRDPNMSILNEPKIKNTVATLDRGSRNYNENPERTHKDRNLTPICEEFNIDSLAIGFDKNQKEFFLVIDRNYTNYFQEMFILPVSLIEEILEKMYDFELNIAMQTSSHYQLTEKSVTQENPTKRRVELVISKEKIPTKVIEYKMNTVKPRSVGQISSSSVRPDELAQPVISDSGAEGIVAECIRLSEYESMMNMVPPYTCAIGEQNLPLGPSSATKEMSEIGTPLGICPMPVEDKNLATGKSDLVSVIKGEFGAIMGQKSKATSKLKIEKGSDKSIPVKDLQGDTVLQNSLKDFEKPSGGYTTPVCQIEYPTFLTDSESMSSILGDKLIGGPSNPNLDRNGKKERKISFKNIFKESKT